MASSTLPKSSNVGETTIPLGNIARRAGNYTRRFINSLNSPAANTSSPNNVNYPEPSTSKSKSGVRKITDIALRSNPYGRAALVGAKLSKNKWFRISLFLSLLVPIIIWGIPFLIVYQTISNPSKVFNNIKTYGITIADCGSDLAIEGVEEAIDVVGLGDGGEIREKLYECARKLTCKYIEVTTKKDNFCEDEYLLDDSCNSNYVSSNPNCAMRFASEWVNEWVWNSSFNTCKSENLMLSEFIRTSSRNTLTEFIRTVLDEVPEEHSNLYDGIYVYTKVYVNEKLDIVTGSLSDVDSQLLQETLDFWGDSITIDELCTL